MDLDEFEHPASIDVETFEHTLSQYSSLLSDKLEALDEKRYNVIPAALAERRASKHMYLAKDQVLDLVTWKLYACLRPTKASYIQYVQVVDHALKVSWYFPTVAHCSCEIQRPRTGQ